MMQKNIASYLLSLSLFCLAAALVYFSMKLVEVTNALPEVMEAINNTTQKIDPIVEEVEQVRLSMPQIIDEIEAVRLTVPTVLNEVEQIRALVPKMIDEIALIRAVIPTITDEVSQVRAVLPSVLKQVDDITTQIPLMTKSVDDFTLQLERTNSKIPAILDEVKLTRESVPETLTRTELIVDKLTTVGKATGEEAVYGVVSGIFKAPLKIVGGLGKAILEPFGKNAPWVEEEDKAIITELIKQVLQQDSSRAFEQRNPVNGNVSKAKLIGQKTINRQSCKVIGVEVTSPLKLYLENELTFCQSVEGEWQTYDN